MTPRAVALDAAKTYYGLKYPDAQARVDALKADILAMYEAGADGKTLTASAADGVSASWMVSMTKEDRVSVLSQLLRILEGKSAGSVVQIFLRDPYPRNIIQ